MTHPLEAELSPKVARPMRDALRRGLRAAPVAYETVPAGRIHSVGWPVIGDEVEVVVVVEHDEPSGLGCCGDQQVGDLRSPLLASLGECILDGDGAVQGLLGHLREGPG